MASFQDEDCEEICQPFAIHRLHAVKAVVQIYDQRGRVSLPRELSSTTETPQSVPAVYRACKLNDTGNATSDNVRSPLYDGLTAIVVVRTC